MDWNSDNTEKAENMSGRSESKSSSDVSLLILRVRSGDQQAFETLLNKYTPLIESSVSKCLGDGMYEHYRDDLAQEATVVFYNSILTYDMDQHEVEFGLYAKICIANALISQLRALKKRNAERLSEDSDDGLFDGSFADDSEDPTLRVLEQESLRSLYSVIRGNLSDFEYLVWQLYMSGRTAREIGRRVGKDERAVNNAIYRIRRKLRERLQ